MFDIKLLVMDVDGTLTDGHIYVSAEGEIMKAFNVKDGYGIARILPKLNITLVIITGRESNIVKKRAEELGIKLVFQGISDKLSILKEIASNLNISEKQIAYIGDDVNDLECIHFCACTACPADSVDDIINEVNYVCKANGGNGAVREFIEYISKIKR